MPPDRQRRRAWPRASVRVGVTVTATLGVAVVLTIASVLLVTFQLDAALGQLDEILSDEAEAIGLAAQSGTPLPMLYDDDRVMVVYDPDGNVVMSAGSFQELVGRQIRTADDKGTNLAFAGQVHRVVSEPYDAADGRSGRVVLAEPRDEIDDTVESLIRSLVVVVPGAVLALAVIVWYVVGRTLRPVEEIRSEVASIGVTQLDHRVTVPPGDDEVARLADTMNDMLARLEQSVHQQQRFVADASHELRTPLTRMRTQLEVAERHPDLTDHSEVHRAQLAELRELQVMLEGLLTLARADDGAEPGPIEAVDLDDLVMEEIAAERLLIPVDASAVSAAQVLGERNSLRRVVRNLLDNAREHARSRIVVSLQESVGVAELTVDDDGPGIPRELRQAVFERFVRLDASRTGSGHHGLGLPIASEIVSRHGGSIEAFDAPGGGARMRVRLPLEGPERGQRQLVSTASASPRRDR